MTLGIDIGAYKIAALLWDGEIQGKLYEPYPAGLTSNYGEWLAWVERLLKDFTKNQNIAATGVAVAGIVAKGGVLKSPNLPILDGAELARDIGRIFGGRVKVENDAKAFLLAESQLGAARGFKNVVGLTLGAGVGGALLINGEIYLGQHASAGEVGHMVLEGEKTFEDLVSKRGFARYSSHLPTELARQARAGDEEAQQVFQEIGKHLGRGIGNIVNVIDPEAVIIGGGIGLTLDSLLLSAQEEAARIIINPEAGLIPILPAHFKEFSSALGAALLD